MAGKECKRQLELFFQHVELEFQVLEHNIPLPKRDLSKQDVAENLTFCHWLIKKCKFT